MNAGEGLPACLYYHFQGEAHAYQAKSFMHGVMIYSVYTQGSGASQPTLLFQVLEVLAGYMFIQEAATRLASVLVF